MDFSDLDTSLKVTLQNVTLYSNWLYNNRKRILYLEKNKRSNYITSRIGFVESNKGAIISFLKKTGLVTSALEVSPLAVLIAKEKLSYRELCLIHLSKESLFLNKKPQVNLITVLSTYVINNPKLEYDLNVIRQLDLSLEKIKNNKDSNRRTDYILTLLEGTDLFKQKGNNDKGIFTLFDNAKPILEYFSKHTIANCEEKLNSDERFDFFSSLEGGVFGVLSYELPPEWIDFFPHLTPDELKTIKSMFDHHQMILPQIFYGAPGTGKTRHVQKIYDKFDEKARVFTTFHQSYSYEDFVEGLKPILEKSSEDVKYQIEKGVFYKACESAAKLAGYSNFKECIEDTKENRTNNFNIAINEGKIMLLCIDEINRGNVASIFGDLISLIEPSKRLGAGEYEMIVTLPYSKEKFGVPANLLIVGTMNTADRSIQLLDSALRRRFEFVEMMPELDTIKYGNAKNVLKNINNRIRCLLNKDNQIGHSYLVNAKSDSDVLKAIVFKIIPLLEEYFYNDIDKVRFVLNETDKVEKPFYIEDEDAAKTYLLYSDGIDEPKSFFKLDETIKDILDDEENSAKYIEHLL